MIFLSTPNSLQPSPGTITGASNESSGQTMEVMLLEWHDTHTRGFHGFLPRTGITTGWTGTFTMYAFVRMATGRLQRKWRRWIITSSSDMLKHDGLDGSRYDETSTSTWPHSKRPKHRIDDNARGCIERRRIIQV